MSNTIKRTLNRIRNFIARVLRIKVVDAYFHSDYIRFKRYSSLDEYHNIVRDLFLLSHILEKGLAMPNRRMGFGSDRFIELKECLLHAYSRYGDEIDCSRAASVMKSYIDLHENTELDMELILTDAEKKTIFGLVNPHYSGVNQTSRSAYFQESYGSFSDFFRSRHSVRSFECSKVSANIIKEAVMVAQKTPSVCNRQATEVLYLNKYDKVQKVLALQNGNRGFGENIHNLIVVTSNLHYFKNNKERNQPYMDGGMFAMSLLMAIHEKNVASVVLNWNYSLQQNQNLQKILDIDDSNAVLMLIAVGYPVEYFSIAESGRKDIDDIFHYIN